MPEFVHWRNQGIVSSIGRVLASCLARRLAPISAVASYRAPAISSGQTPYICKEYRDQRDREDNHNSCKQAISDSSRAPPWNEATHGACPRPEATLHRPWQAVADWHLVVEARERNGHEEQQTRIRGTSQEKRRTERSSGNHAGLSGSRRKSESPEGNNVTGRVAERDSVVDGDSESARLAVPLEFNHYPAGLAGVRWKKADVI